MSTNLEKLLNQYAERINELQIQVAKLQDELEQYESSAEDLAEEQEQEQCGCPACTLENLFESMGIPKEGLAPEEGNQQPDTDRGVPAELKELFEMLGAGAVTIRVRRSE